MWQDFESNPNFRSNKAHGHELVSIMMLKLSSPSVLKPLSLIFLNCLNSGTFPDELKKASNVLVHQENSKQLVNKYRPA